jgi:hypothetical protein
MIYAGQLLNSGCWTYLVPLKPLKPWICGCKLWVDWIRNIHNRWVEDAAKGI